MYPVHFVWASDLSKNRKKIEKKNFFFGKISTLRWVFGHQKMQKNAKIGCFDHLWLHKTHFCVQAYTNTVVIQGDFWPKKNFYNTYTKWPGNKYVMLKTSKFFVFLHFWANLSPKKFFFSAEICLCQKKNFGHFISLLLTLSPCCSLYLPPAHFISLLLTLSPSCSLYLPGEIK